MGRGRWAEWIKQVATYLEVAHKTTPGSCRHVELIEKSTHDLWCMLASDAFDRRGLRGESWLYRRGGRSHTARVQRDRSVCRS
jgi:hypothetical protein